MSAATLAALIGCTGFDLIGPPDENAPHIGVSLDAVHETHSSYLLQAFFQPGTDAQGEPLASDLMLQVNGEPVEPTSAGRDLWRYQWQTTLIGRIDRADTIRLVVPRVSGLNDQGRTIALPIAVSPDPLDVPLTAGEDLRLHVTPAPGPPGFTSEPVRWQLRITASCEGNVATQVRIDASGSVSEIRVPWQLIENQSTPFEACLTSFSTHRAVGPPYTVQLFSSVRVRWRISVGRRE